MLLYMKVVRLKDYNPPSEFIEKVAGVFEQGGIVAYPTDSIYGLGCLADNISAIENLCRLKGRDVRKPMIVLMRDISAVEEYCRLNQEQRDYLGYLWPHTITGARPAGWQKPVTVILEAKEAISPLLTGMDGSLAVRVPQFTGRFSGLLGIMGGAAEPGNPHYPGLPNKDFLIKLLKRVQKPIIATSLNISGKAPIREINGKNLILSDKVEVDMAVAAGKAGDEFPSKIVDIRDINNIQVLRS